MSITSPLSRQSSLSEAPDRADPVVAVFGEALIDLVHGAADGALAYQGHVGGGPCNTAIGVARLGVATAFVGRLGTDSFAQAIRSHFAGSNVDLRLVVDSSDPTMMAVVSVNDSGNATYAFYLDGTADVGLTSTNLQALPASVRVIHAGTLALSLEPVGSTIVGVLEKVRAQPNRPIIAIDPNVRLLAIRDVAAYRERITSVVAMADVVKISDADIESLWPDHDINTVAQRLVDSGPALLCVTRGGNGVTVFHKGKSFEIAAAPVAVVDTIGAGDTFNAALIAWLVDHSRLSRDSIDNLTEGDVVDAASYAARAAAITCGRAGANPPWAAEMILP